MRKLTTQADGALQPHSQYPNEAHRKSPSAPLGGQPPTTSYYYPRCRVGMLTTARGLALSEWVVGVMIAHPFHGVVEQFAEIVAPGGVR